MKCITDLCDSCGVCTAVCPFAAVIIEGESIRFLESCTQCDLCTEVCPTGAILQDDESYNDRWDKPSPTGKRAGEVKRS
jgi:ferredoxin